MIPVFDPRPKNFARHEIFRHQERHPLVFDCWRSCWRVLVCLLLLAFDASGSFRCFVVTRVASVVEKLEHGLIFLSGDWRASRDFGSV